jgi:hypothetical protein
MKAARTRMAVLAFGVVFQFLSASVHAATFTFSYEFQSGEILSGTLEGTMQGDNDTVSVSSLINSGYTGDQGLAFTTNLLSTSKTASLSGENMDFATLSSATLGVWMLNSSLLAPGEAIVAAPGSPFPITLDQESYAAANWTMAAVPLPAAFWLFGSALGFLYWKRQKPA